MREQTEQTMTQQDLPLVLASSSIYRRELLERLHLPFTIDSPDIDETPHPGETPQATALRLAEAKARAVGQRIHPALIIGSDQVVMLGEQQMGKPGNHENAVRQLQLLRGKEVTFHTALCLFNTETGRVQIEDVLTRVRFRELTDAQIERYLRMETPYNCAGSAKSEGLGIALLEWMHSDDPNALIGLPLIALINMLAEEGINIF